MQPPDLFLGNRGMSCLIGTASFGVVDGGDSELYPEEWPRGGDFFFVFFGELDYHALY